MCWIWPFITATVASRPLLITAHLWTSKLRGSPISASSLKASEYLRIPSIHRVSHGIPDGLHLSHLCCDRDHPERVQTILSLSLQAQLIRRRYDAPSAHRHAKSGLNAIGEANVRLLDHFVASAQASSHLGATTLASAARRQASIIVDVLRC